MTYSAATALTSTAIRTPQAPTTNLSAPLAWVAEAPAWVEVACAPVVAVAALTTTPNDGVVIVLPAEFVVVTWLDAVVVAVHPLQVVQGA